jgi:hypothetical protein
LKEPVFKEALSSRDELRGFPIAFEVTPDRSATPWNVMRHRRPPGGIANGIRNKINHSLFTVADDGAVRCERIFQPFQMFGEATGHKGCSDDLTPPGHTWLTLLDA